MLSLVSRYTVHQPTLFPPVYLWARFAAVDSLILLNTDLTKQDGLHSRFYLPMKPGGCILVTAPLRDRFGKQIDSVEFADPERFFMKLEKTLRQHYGGLRHIEQTLDLIRYQPGETFGEYCTRTIRAIAVYIGLHTTIETVQELGVTKLGSASEWLAEIGHQLGATRYLCAKDAHLKYLDSFPFDVRDIGILCQDYSAPEGIDARMSILSLLVQMPPHEIREILYA